MFRNITIAEQKKASQTANITSRRPKEVDPGVRQEIRTVDFANFSYLSEPLDGTHATFTLNNGVYKGPMMDPCPFDPADCYEPTSLVAVAYGDVTGDDREEAMVVLTESTWGTAIPYWVYVYSLNNGQPKLLWAFATGDRAQGGLRKVYADQSNLVVELYGEGARVDGEIYVDVPNGCCCPIVFTRTSYHWLDDHFESHGESEVFPVKDGGDVEMELFQDRGVIPKTSPPKEIWIGDVLTRDNRLNYGHYILEKRQRKVRYDYSREARSPSLWVDVSFAVLKRRGKVLARFDDNIYFGMGNDTRFGLVSILGSQVPQVIISQDVPRGGTQWIISLSEAPRLIFDGPRWRVGRECDDMGLIDLDGDGVYEITVPIADFYDLQDKMSMSQIPLPEVVFRYDRAGKKYFPANPQFQNYLLAEVSALDDRLNNKDPFELRSAVLKTLLTYIYVGRERGAWEFYDRNYQLDDKAEIKRRVKSILRKEPVYKFIYNRTKKRQ